MIKPDQLKNDMRVKVQLSKRDNWEGDAPEWRDPQVVTLYVDRHEKDYKRGKEFYPAGELLIMTIKDFGWAEYGMSDYCPEHDEWLCEEYRMKILEIVND